MEHGHFHSLYRPHDLVQEISYREPLLGFIRSFAPHHSFGVSSWSLLKSHLQCVPPPFFWASASLVQLATAAYGLFDDYGVGNNFFERFDFFTVSFLTSPSHVSAQSIDQWSRAMIPRTAMSSM